MRTIIGAYHSLEAAQTAARALEQQISIQNIVVGVRRGLRSRTGRGMREHESEERDPGDFVLSMSGTAHSIEQARALLRSQSKPT